MFHNENWTFIRTLFIRSSYVVLIGGDSGEVCFENLEIDSFNQRKFIDQLIFSTENFYLTYEKVLQERLESSEYLTGS